MIGVGGGLILKGFKSTEEDTTRHDLRRRINLMCWKSWLI